MRFNDIINQYLEEEIDWQYSDGGRLECGMGGTGKEDCVPRAIAHVTDIPYVTVHNDLTDITKEKYRSLNIDPDYVDIDARGVHMGIAETYLIKHGFKKVYENTRSIKNKRIFIRSPYHKYNIEYFVEKYGSDNVVMLLKKVVKTRAYFHMIAINTIDGEAKVLDTWDSRYKPFKWWFQKNNSSEEVVQVYIKR